MVLIGEEHIQVLTQLPLQLRSQKGSWCNGLCLEREKIIMAWKDLERKVVAFFSRNGDNHGTASIIIRKFDMAPASKGKSNESKKPQSRPSASPKKVLCRDRLDEIGIEALCEFIADGNSMNEFCRQNEFTHATVLTWIDDPDQPERAKRYARAREVRADKLVEEIMSISDDGRNDTYVDDNGNKKTDWDIVARSKLRVDSRKWFASKLAPKKYGDRQIISGDPEAPLGGSAKIDLSALSDAELQAYLALQRKLEGKA